MFILLPPSEKKRPGGSGKSLAQRHLTGPLGGTRAVVLQSLERLCDTTAEEAAARLLLPPSVVDEALARNRTAQSSPTMPAYRRYLGTVYEGLQAESLPAGAVALLKRKVLIFSGLFGVVSGGEMIPDYRVPAKANLPGIGVVRTFWKPTLVQTLPTMLRSEPVLDLRSSDYGAMWRVPEGMRARTIAVRIVSPTRSGYGVVSYNSKFGKGILARELLLSAAAGQQIQSAEDVIDVWRKAGGHDGELIGDRRASVVELRTL